MQLLGVPTSKLPKQECEMTSSHGYIRERDSDIAAHLPARPHVHICLKLLAIPEQGLEERVDQEIYPGSTTAGVAGPEDEQLHLWPWYAVTDGDGEPNMLFFRFRDVLVCTVLGGHAQQSNHPSANAVGPLGDSTDTTLPTCPARLIVAMVPSAVVAAKPSNGDADGWYSGGDCGSTRVKDEHRLILVLRSWRSCNDKVLAAVCKARYWR